MKKSEKLLIEIDKIRKRFNLCWGKVLCETGAIVLKKPSLFSCYIGLLYQCGRDINSKDVENFLIINTDPPYIDINNSGDEETYNISITKESLMNFCILNEEIKRENLTERIKDLKDKIINNKDLWIEEFKEIAEEFKEM